jgi:hypothetical protein
LFVKRGRRREREKEREGEGEGERGREGAEERGLKAGSGE